MAPSRGTDGVLQFEPPLPQRGVAGGARDDVVVAERGRPRDDDGRRRRRRRRPWPACRGAASSASSRRAQPDLDGDVRARLAVGADVAADAQRQPAVRVPVGRPPSVTTEGGRSSSVAARTACDRASLPGCAARRRAGRRPRRRRWTRRRAARSSRAARAARRRPCRRPRSASWGHAKASGGGRYDRALGQGVRGGVGHVPRAAEVDAPPERPVVDLDPRVGLVEDQARRDAQALRRHEEREGPVAADALLRQRQVEVHAAAPCGGSSESAKPRKYCTSLRDGLARAHARG